MVYEYEWYDHLCCQADDGGSHYHCPYCGQPTGMMGCYDPDAPNKLGCPPKKERPAWWTNHVSEDEEG